MATTVHVFHDIASPSPSNQAYLDAKEKKTPQEWETWPAGNEDIEEVESSMPGSDLHRWRVPSYYERSLIAIGLHDIV